MFGCSPCCSRGKVLVLVLFAAGKVPYPLLFARDRVLSPVLFAGEKVPYPVLFAGEKFRPPFIRRRRKNRRRPESIRAAARFILCPVPSAGKPRTDLCRLSRLIADCRSPIAGRFDLTVLQSYSAKRALYSPYTRSKSAERFSLTWLRYSCVSNRSASSSIMATAMFEQWSDTRR